MSSTSDNLTKKKKNKTKIQNKTKPNQTTNQIVNITFQLIAFEIWDYVANIRRDLQKMYFNWNHE